MERPKLRKVERFQHARGDEALVVVRDPLGLSEPFAVDAELAVVLDLLDGRRTIAQIRQSLLLAHGLDVDARDLAEFVQQLAEAGLLDDDEFRERWAQVHADFLDAPRRPATLAGVVYPAHPGELAAALERAIPSSVPRTDPSSTTIAVAVPHAPPDRAAAILDRTLRTLPPADRLEAVIVLGTDHGPGLLPYVATDKPHCTPLGEVATATGFLDALQRRVPWIRREEIRHREALSIELAALYLLHVYGEACPPIVPILCGRTVLDARRDDEDTVEPFVSALDALCEDRRVLVWVSAELSHAGPAYGYPPLDDQARQSLEARDRAILAALREGRAERVAMLCAAEHPQGRPSGGPALATAIRILPVGFRSEVVAYDLVQAPGDAEGVVGMAGVRLHGPV